MKRSLLQAGLMLAITCLLLVTTEVVLRFLDPTPEGMLLPRFHEDLSGDLEPGIRVHEQVNSQLGYTVSSDEQGFRSNGSGPRTASPQVRILCLGDSYTYGYGVDDAFTYPAQLQSMLAASRPDLSFDVINAGYPRYGLTEEASFYTRKGTALKPDIVILQFFLNDIQDMCREIPFGIFLQEAARPGRRNFLERALSRTELYRTARKFNIARASKAPFFASEEERQILTQGSPLRKLLTSEQKSLVSTYEGIVNGESPRVLGPLWREYIEKVLALRDKVVKDGGKFLFMIVPDEQQISRHQLAASRCLVPELLANGVDVLDLTFDFMAQRYNGASPLYLRSDPHCSPAGNALIARHITDRLSFNDMKPYIAWGNAAVRDYGREQMLTLNFDAKLNAVIADSSAEAGVMCLQNNLNFSPDKEFGITSLACEGSTQPGVLDLTISPRLATAFLDAQFHYRLPTPDSSISLFSSEDGANFVPVLKLSARRIGTRANLETECIAQIPFTPCPSQQIRLRFVLYGGASLVTDTPGCKEGAGPLRLALYPSLGSGKPPDVPLTQFPEPVPGDFFNKKTLSPAITVQGLLDEERSPTGTWRWGLGPQTEISFRLESPQPLRLDLSLNNVIEGQEITVLANGKTLTKLSGLSRQKWLVENTHVSLPFQGVAGINSIILRYTKWNGHGGDVSTTDPTSYSVAFTKFAILGLP